MSDGSNHCPGQTLARLLQSVLVRARVELAEVKESASKAHETLDQCIAKRMAAESDAIDGLLIVIKVSGPRISF